MIILKDGLWPEISSHVNGYFKYYDREMAVGEARENQVKAWKDYLQGRRLSLTQYGEHKDAGEGTEAKNAELRANLVFPAFWDPLTQSHEPLLPILRDTFAKYGFPKFPDTRTPEGKAQMLRFHREFKDILAVSTKA